VVPPAALEPIIYDSIVFLMCRSMGVLHHTLRTFPDLAPADVTTNLGSSPGKLREACCFATRSETEWRPLLRCGRPDLIVSYLQDHSRYRLRLFSLWYLFTKCGSRLLQPVPTFASSMVSCWRSIHRTLTSGSGGPFQGACSFDCFNSIVFSRGRFALFDFPT